MSEHWAGEEVAALLAGYVEDEVFMATVSVFQEGYFAHLGSIRASMDVCCTAGSGVESDFEAKALSL